MKVGVVGLGKLGMPVALAMALKGHDVMGYDIDPTKMLREGYPHLEAGPNGEPSIEPLLRESALRFGSVADLVRHAALIFVAVQTPHAPLYEGSTRLPEERANFDYSFLRDTVAHLSGAIDDLGQDRIVAIVSTVLPGTIRREIVPLVGAHVTLCYNPLFIAMGSTIRDFLDPEFVLLGFKDKGAVEKVKAFYQTLHNKRVYETTVENAELIKVAYNTYISMKISFANVLMEICHKVPGCDVDSVSDALALADERLLSPRYMRGGMGDGGSCHPRDNIALSWLARDLGLSYDWFEQLMLCRESQTAWLADLVEEHHRRREYRHRRVGIYGRAFKAGTNVTAGSPASLLASILAERGFEVSQYDPHVDVGACPLTWAGIYVVATNHSEFARDDWRFPAGSVVIDPWRYLPQQPGVEIIPVGVGGADDSTLISRERKGQQSHAG